MFDGPEPAVGGTGIRRPRRRACDACRQRKIKCDGATPQCDWCRHHGTDCVLSRSQDSRPRLTSSSQDKKLRETNLVQRLERMERILTENLQKRTGISSPPNVDAYLTPGVDLSQQGVENSKIVLRPNAQGSDESGSSNHDMTNVGQIYLASYKLGDINLFHGVPFLSREGQRWIGVRSEEDEPERITDKFPGPLWLNQHQDFRPESLLRSTMKDLPPRTALESYLERHFQSDFSSMLPLIDPVLFAANVEKAYNATSTYEALTAKASIFAFLALRARVDNSEEDSLALQPVDGYEVACRLLLPDLFSARASSEIVGTLMMLAVYQFGHGNIHCTDIIMSLASRFLFMLGAHLFPGIDIDGLPNESRSIEARKVLYQRDLFWICYSLDKEITFRTGRPPIINDTSCDLTFPAYYLKQMSRGSHSVWRLPGDLRLSIIKSRAYEKLYSPQSSHKSDAEVLKDIRKLDDLLENWRLSLPIGSRPTLSLSESISTKLDVPSWNISALMVRLEYYHCVTTIHQASSCRKNLSHKLQADEGLRSSIELAVQSSRCQLFYLHLGQPILTPNIFWVVLFYALSASLILFCHLLSDPSVQTARSDLKLLKQCLYFIEEKFQKNLKSSEKQALHIKRVYEAIKEVVRRAESAILSPTQLD